MVGQPRPEATFPTWRTDIADLFAAPFWVTPARRADVAGQWLGCMKDYAVDLSDYDSVKAWSIRIYQYLHSREMPLTDDETQKWPDDALELFRLWVNQGWRRDAADPFDRDERIPQPRPRPAPLRLRRDLRSLSQAELDDYRMRFEDAFQVADAAPDAPGQVFFSIHGDWCLHYQEAFLLWHRAYLMALEQRLGCAVPYWNWYAQDAAVDGAPSAGLPQAFKDTTYVHPVTGEVRPNPLRFAAAKGGSSKACAACGPPSPGVDCRWVQRDPLLYTEGDDQRAARTRKIGLTLQYQLQVQRALRFKDFSHPQGVGYPWANIQSFAPPPPDSQYVYRDYNFDGAYEQPHDNYHGWVGPDMADNAYTAFDPVFWSYHANIDRIFEIWLRANATGATFTANYPLHPFAGAHVERFEFTDPRGFVYTTIGDLAKDCRGLGYDFAAPIDPDFGTGATATRSAPAGDADELLVLFDDVRCTLDSYAIDVFLDAGPDQQTPDGGNDRYVGRLSRIGMGQADDKGRCIVKGVRRMLDASATARALGLKPGDMPALILVVTDLATGRAVPAADQDKLPGFKGQLVWAKAGWAPRAPSAPLPASVSCCS
jgi:tyrosinase